VSLASDNTDVATIVGGQIHIVGAGSATITASQAGNTLWNAATNVPQTLNVAQATQTITFPALPTVEVGDPDFDPGATASSGLTVSYSSENTDVATIVGEMIHIVATGEAVITASQPGNTNYSAATDVPQTLTVDVTTNLEYPDVSRDRFIIYTTSRNKINIKSLADEWDGQIGSIRVIDITGKPVHTLQAVEFRKNSIIRPEVQLTKGIYIVELRAGELRYSGKVGIR
jgi:sorbitol-specific phosphotransferase system component IIBC